ncbi:hypothetical protein BW14_06095 [Bifidobacterium sp. UTBIF-68]|uniref:hypothetical protein n=1 Tax=Bifidobacterium sp. UTBIF-68 TaxID=1465262 RepID=UPI0011266C21|nr:hypothetical protein [Bifidobacterium sp. UTBIF-68]TPF93245.1 hypothetical protein BW14_06095 [Bifidobacterium sp. UTBIF-68]
MSATVSVTIEGPGDGKLAGTAWNMSDDIQTYIYPQDIDQFTDALEASDLISEGPSDEYTRTFYAEEYKDLTTALGQQAEILHEAPNDQYAESPARVEILY